MSSSWPSGPSGTTWETGEPLAFRGEFYTHTLMTPFFDPGPNPYGNPKILLAAVGELMTEVAGEVGDGFLVHGFSTERYLREVSLPALERGAAKGGKTRADLTVSYPGFVVTGPDEQSMEAAAKGVREQIAFYGSTPAYRPCSSCTAGATSSPSSTRSPSGASG